MRSKRGQGFTLVEIMIVVAIIAILAAIAIPAFLRYRQQSGSASCLATIMSIQGAKEAVAASWHPATYEAEKDNAIPDDEVMPFLRGGELGPCPNQGTYTIGNITTWPRCSNQDGEDLCQHDDAHFPDL